MWFDKRSKDLARKANWRKYGRKMTEAEIDELVEKQADDESAWDEPVRVRKTKGASISIPPDLAARAAFLAKLHRKSNMEEWLTRVIQERIELDSNRISSAFYPKIGVHLWFIRRNHEQILGKTERWRDHGCGWRHRHQPAKDGRQARHAARKPGDGRPRHHP
ncbi:MAG: hypothetical protein ACOYYU_19975 [Chloroflexota bacterium]